MNRSAILVAAIALAGCGSLPEGSFPTPWGVIDLEGSEPPTPEQVRQARDQVAAARVGIDDATDRMRDLEVCVSRVEFNGVVDACLCYVSHGFPVPRACRTHDARSDGPVAATLPQGVAESPFQPENGTTAGGADVSLREQLKAAENFVSSERNGHICWGHYVLPGEIFPTVVTVAECEALLDADIEKARVEAVRVFGTASDAHIELCYWSGCARFGTAPDLAAAVRTDPSLDAVDSARAARIAREIP